MSAVTMTSADVREALKGRWPDSEYLHIAEAPQDAGRQGRKLDVLVVSQWASRGHELDGVEIKVSASDWKRELDNAEKADWWWAHVDRFWIAVPTELEAKVRSELPSSWGLISCAPTGTKIAVKSPKHDREPMSWNATVGLLRAAADAGPNALLRARQRGSAEGYELGKRDGEARTTEGYALVELKALSEKVEAFKSATGVDIAGTWSRDIERIARGVRVADRYNEDPAQVLATLERAVTAMKQAGQQIEELQGRLAGLTEPLEQAS